MPRPAAIKAGSPGRRQSGLYILPFHITPFPESTFQVDVNIIAAKTAAPSGMVNANQGEIPIACEARPRT